MSNDLVADISDYLACYPREREAFLECPLAESLRKMVRRILRTQSKRTRFEVCVLDEARRLANDVFGVFWSEMCSRNPLWTNCWYNSPRVVTSSLRLRLN
jgi:hypothetical protein